MIVDVNNQLHLEMLLNNNILKVIELILSKMKKYEEIGRLDKAFLITSYLNKIYLMVRYWHYSKLPYSQLPECLETTLECSLSELKEKLKILPRELYLDISLLLAQIGEIGEGINNQSIVEVNTTNNTGFSDFQSV